MHTAFDQKDWHTYSVNVHATKSTSRTIGADELADMAARLEIAANAEDLDTLLDGHARFMEEYKTLSSAIPEN